MAPGGCTHAWHGQPRLTCMLCLPHKLHGCVARASLCAGLHAAANTYSRAQLTTLPTCSHLQRKAEAQHFAADNVMEGDLQQQIKLAKAAEVSAGCWGLAGC